MSTHFSGSQGTVHMAPAVTRLAFCHESVLLDRVWTPKLEVVRTKRAGSSENLRCEEARQATLHTPEVSL